MATGASIAVAAMLAAGVAIATAPGTADEFTAASTIIAQAGGETEEPIFGSQMMTTQERAEFRERMRMARSAEERARLRAQHHQLMMERARDRGIPLPDGPSSAPGMSPGLGTPGGSIDRFRGGPGGASGGPGGGIGGPGGGAGGLGGGSGGGPGGSGGGAGGSGGGGGGSGGGGGGG